MKKESRKHGISILKSYRDFILDFKFNYSKRNKIIGESSMIYKNLITIKYYIQNIKKFNDL